ncbi:MAG: class I SAM-dependent rRNA methyltransferase [Thermoanaerobaculia bacterium]
MNFDAPRRRVRLKAGRDRSIRNRHPWVFDGAIAREEGSDAAALADVFDAGGTRVASGFYSRHSQIRVRAIAFGDAELTETLVRERIARAVARRAAILNGGTTACRLVHAEGDDLSGLIADRYGDVLVVEITSAGLDLLRDVVLDGLRAATGLTAIHVKNEIPARKLERLPLEDVRVGDPAAETTVAENGLRFVVHPGGGQKTGFFLDQRENRARVRTLAAGCDVLNLFAYSGGFGVYAAAEGARTVEEVDVSAEAIELARRNHELNPSQTAVTFTVADAFQHVRAVAREGRTFDLIVCDPPAFARARGEVERAARGYKDINLYAFRLLRPGGKLVTFSCSGHMSADLFQKVIFSAALDAGREARILARLGAGPDHPVSVYCPEGEYLKGLLVGV